MNQELQSINTTIGHDEKLQTDGSHQVIDASFSNRVEALGKIWQEVESIYETLVEKQLRFAMSVREIYEEAKLLDKQSVSRTHSTFLKQKLSEIIKSDNKSILSRWNTIAEHAEKFLPHVEQLPAQRDGLYALAVSINKDKPVDEWIEKGLLRSDMSVREVQALAAGIETSRSRSTAKMDRLVNVTLSFSGTYEEIAEILKDILQDDSLIEIKSKDALRETFKSKLGMSNYGKVARKFAIT